MENPEQKREDKGLLEWADMSDAEFFLRYLGDASEEELAEFLEMVPEFMEDIS